MYATASRLAALALALVMAAPLAMTVARASESDGDYDLNAGSPAGSLSDDRNTPRPAPRLPSPDPGDLEPVAREIAALQGGNDASSLDLVSSSVSATAGGPLYTFWFQAEDGRTYAVVLDASGNPAAS